LEPIGNPSVLAFSAFLASHGLDPARFKNRILLGAWDLQKIFKKLFDLVFHVNSFRGFGSSSQRPSLRAELTPKGQRQFVIDKFQVLQPLP
jgi:hypothetical protein